MVNSARTALITWAVTYPPRAANQSTPGLLPFPDRNADGNYDGRSDCVSPGVLRDAHLLGRFPTAGHTSGSGPCAAVPLYIDLHDAAGEPLWYAVSRNLVKGADAGPLNPDMGDPDRARYPWIRVIGADGSVLRDRRTGAPLAVAAVVIAPGPALPGQDRRGVAPAPREFLDRITIGGRLFDNADADGCPDAAAAPCEGALAGEEFVLVPDPPAGSAFNDRLVLITVDELMRAVETRVLGEVELALEAYRERFATFPWLAPFRSPRGVVSGEVVSTGAGYFRGSMGDPAGAGVRVGDVVMNVSDGAWGPVTGVDGDRLFHAGLTGGADNAFEMLDAYRVMPTYRAASGVRVGLLPVHRRDEIFRTAFTGHWQFDDETPSVASEYHGDGSLVPPFTDLVAGVIDVPVETGWCLWERPERATCIGSVETIHYRADLGIPVTRRVEVSFDVEGEVNVHAPTATDVRRRSIGVNSLAPGYLDRPARLPAPLLPRVAWAIRITDGSGDHWGRRAIAIDADTRGQIALEGIAYDLAVVYDDADTAADEIPEWLVENAWHELIHVALSAQAAPGGTGACTPGADCLSLHADQRMAFDNGVNALLVSAGGPWNIATDTSPFAGQSRDTGVGDCDWDGAPDGAGNFLCAYLEGENNGGDGDVFARGVPVYGSGAPLSLPFNDQVRIMDPPPPPLPSS